MTIITDLNFFDTVYLVNDPEQLQRTMTGMAITPSGCGHYQVIYIVTCGMYQSNHYREELSRTKDEAKIITS